MKKILFLLAIGLFTWSCANSQQTSQKRDKNVDYPEKPIPISKMDEQFSEYERAVFAGGCFWCVEEVFERVKGVEEAISGYAGGTSKNPTYREVASGATDYAEAVIVFYDPEKISYEDLLTAFFSGHDPTQLNRQGPDVGPQYRSAIFYQNEEEKQKAQAYVNKLEASGKYKEGEIVTRLSPLGTFWVAEAYHQDYYPAHPNQPYIVSVSKPKVEKFTKAHPELLKEEYKK